MSLAERSVRAVGWNALSNSARVVILFGRSVLLARWLPVETFGVYAGANAIVALAGIVATFGLGPAFLHRCAETEDEERTAAVHFTLQLILTLGWTVLMLLGTALFAQGETRLALLLMTGTTAITQLTLTPRLILVRRVVHRRLALLDFVNAVLTTAVAVGLAWKGMRLWALLATDVVAVLLALAMLYAWRPVWRPHLAWDGAIVRYFLGFGGRTFLATTLQYALDRVDDLWTRFYLGTNSMGLYSRAYTFATYPRIILAMPINVVAGGTYSELKGQRVRLSQAFFRTNALLVRTGFLLAGILALIAPEFIRLLLGVKWLPMLDAFRLMLIYTLLDPIKLTVANVITASGAPERVVRARLVQLAILVAGLVTLGPRLGIVGVAVSVDLMLVVGILLLLREARRYVDFSWLRLFAIPSLALSVGLLAGRLALNLPGVLESDWASGVVKTAVFSSLYVGILFSLERENVMTLLDMLKRLHHSQRVAGKNPGE
jgi:O-antigen/teichoic acid export membrane protein